MSKKQRQQQPPEKAIETATTEQPQLPVESGVEINLPSELAGKVAKALIEKALIQCCDNCTAARAKCEDGHSLVLRCHAGPPLRANYPENPGHWPRVHASDWCRQWQGPVQSLTTPEK